MTLFNILYIFFSYLLLITMTIDDKINNIKQYLEEYIPDPNKKIFESILDILKEINEEIDELNESIHF